MIFDSETPLSMFDDRLKIVTNMTNELKFIKALQNYNRQEKLDLLQKFKLRKVIAGTRIGHSSSMIDTYSLVISGKVGIFYPDPIVASLDPKQIVFCSEQEGVQRM